MFHRRLILPESIAIVNESTANPQHSSTLSLRKRRLSLPELDLPSFKRQSKSLFPGETNPFIKSSAGQPLHHVDEDATFLQDVLTELRNRIPKPGTWDEQNVKAMLRLLGRAMQPVTIGNNDTVEAYFLSGSYAEARLQPDITLNGPIITTQQQSFQWSKESSRPINQLFERMWYLNREVSVQDFSRPVGEKSCKKMTLYHVRESFLKNSDSQRLSVLKMRNPLPRSTLPHFLTGEDCQLLSQIRDVVLDDAPARQISATAKKWKEWKDDEEWIVLAQRGALTLTHQDSCGKATWFTVQEGLVGFGWVSRPTAEERSEWSQDPINFCPKRIRYVVLRVGETIYFESGTIHFVFRLQETQTLMFGGHVLRWSRMPLWIDALQEQLHAPNTSDEDISPRIVRTYVDAVVQLVKDRAERGMDSGVAETFLSLKDVGTLTGKYIYRYISY